MPSALFVTTVPITLEAFLLPFADHFRAQGWRVDALANGAASDPRLAGRFDERFDVAWSRDPLSPSNFLGAAGTVRGIVEAGGYDIVHVHTPVAAFVTRYALRRAARPRGSPGGDLHRARLPLLCRPERAPTPPSAPWSASPHAGPTTSSP